MVGWHHRLYGYEFEYAMGIGDGQGRAGWIAGCAAVLGITKSQT